MQVTISAIIFSLSLIEKAGRHAKRLKNIKNSPIMWAASTLVLQQQGIFEKLFESKLFTLKQNNLQLGNVALIFYLNLLCKVERPKVIPKTLLLWLSYACSQLQKGELESSIHCTVMLESIFVWLWTLYMKEKIIHIMNSPWN